MVWLARTPPGLFLPFPHTTLRIVIVPNETSGQVKCILWLIFNSVLGCFVHDGPSLSSKLSTRTGSLFQYTERNTHDDNLVSKLVVSSETMVEQ